jgi:hypothetical protein
MQDMKVFRYNIPCIRKVLEYKDNVEEQSFLKRI